MYKWLIILYFFVAGCDGGEGVVPDNKVMTGPGYDTIRFDLKIINNRDVHVKMWIMEGIRDSLYNIELHKATYRQWVRAIQIDLEETGSWVQFTDAVPFVPKGQFDSTIYLRYESVECGQLDPVDTVYAGVDNVFIVDCDQP